MLVLTRKTQQQIQIGDKITITILRVKGNSVRVGIDAPRDERIIRSELHDKPLPAPKTNLAAATRGIESVTAIDINAGPAPLSTVANEIALDERDAAAVAMVRPLASRVRVLNAQAIRYPERLSAASLRCALGRR